MTDEKADELAKLALELENQRNDLKKICYEKVREQHGGILAARFLQVENQLLMVIDLQIASSLPIVSSGPDLGPEALRKASVNKSLPFSIS